MVGILTVLTALRLIVALAIEHSVVGAAGEALVLIPLVFAWQNLRKQAASFDTEAHQQTT